MDNFGFVLVLISLLGVIVFFIKSIVSFFKKNGTVKKNIFFTGGFFVLLIGGAILVSIGTPAEEVAKQEQATEQAKADKLAKEEAAKKAEADKLAKEKAAKKAEADKLAKEKAAKKAEADKLAKEEAAKKAEADKLAKAEAAKKAEADKLAKEKAAKKAEADKLAKEKAAKKAEADKLAKEEAANQKAFKAYAANIKGSTFVKTISVADNKGNIEFFGSFSEYKQANPNTNLTNADYKGYFDTGEAVQKLLVGENVRLLREFPDLESTSMVLPYGGKTYFMDLDRKEVNNYIGFKVEKLSASDGSWQSKFSNPYIYDEGKREKFFDKFVEVKS